MNSRSQPAVVAAFAALVAFPAGARAEAEPVVVVVESADASVQADAIRQAISNELGTQAVGPAAGPSPQASGVLTVALDTERRLVLSYRDRAGHEIWRSVSVPEDPAGAIGAIAMLAGNLARNQTSELLEEIPQPQTPPPAPVPVIAQPAPVVVVQQAPPQAVTLQDSAIATEAVDAGSSWSVEWYGGGAGVMNGSGETLLAIAFGMRRQSGGFTYAASYIGAFGGAVAHEWDRASFDRHSLLFGFGRHFAPEPLSVDITLDVGPLITDARITEPYFPTDHSSPVSFSSYPWSGWGFYVGTSCTTGIDLSSRLALNARASTGVAIIDLPIAGFTALDLSGWLGLRVRLD